MCLVQGREGHCGEKTCVKGVVLFCVLLCSVFCCERELVLKVLCCFVFSFVLFCSERELVCKVDEWCRWTRETPSFNVTRPETRRWGGHIWAEVGWQNLRLGGGVAKFPHFPQGLYFAFTT